MPTAVMNEVRGEMYGPREKELGSDKETRELGVEEHHKEGESELGECKNYVEDGLSAVSVKRAVRGYLLCSFCTRR